MKKEWNVTAQQNINFSVKITDDILNPTNKLLIENGNSKRRIVFVDSKVFKTHASNIKNYFEKNNIESKILSIDIFTIPGRKRVYISNGWNYKNGCNKK